jgi:hypothetical protein
MNIATALRANRVSIFVPIYVTRIKHLVPTATAILFFHLSNVFAIPVFVGAVLKLIRTTRARPIVLILIFPMVIGTKLHRVCL